MRKKKKKIVDKLVFDKKILQLISWHFHSIDKLVFNFLKKKKNLLHQEKINNLSLI